MARDPLTDPLPALLTGGELLRVDRVLARRNGGDLRHLTRTEYNASLRSVAVELYPHKVGAAASQPQKAGD